MRLKTFLPGDVTGKKVLVRVDFNVPLEDGKVADPTRICAHLPTLRALKAAGAKVALISHLGRPKGTADMKYSLKPVGEELANITGWDVRFVPECVGPDVEKATSGWGNEVLLLENVRFHPEEEKHGFCKKTGRELRPLCHGRIQRGSQGPFFNKGGRGGAPIIRGTSDREGDRDARNCP